MKKTLAVILTVAFALTVAASSFARTIEEERQAVRNYLKVVDAKIIKFRKQGNTKKMKQMQNEKKATLRRWEALKAKMEKEAETAAPWVPPAPKPVAPAAEATKTAAPSKSTGLSLGVKFGLSGGATGMIVDLDYSVSKFIPGTKIRVGGDYLTGTNPNGNDSYKISNLRLGLVYALDMLKSEDMPIDWYVTGSFLYPWKVNAGRAGSWGIEAAFGGNYVVEDFGCIYGEIGYAGIKYTSSQPALKAMSAAVGYSYLF